MLNFIFLIGPGLLGASIGWLTAAYLAIQTGIEQAIFASRLLGNGSP